MGAIVLLIISCLTFLSISQLLTFGSFKHRSIAWILSKHSKLFLRALNVSVVGELPKLPFGLIVANHLSYLDVVALAALVPTMFVTSDEMARQPIFGLMARLADCILVDRKRFTTLLKDLKELSILLDKGQLVTLFPEATTSTGNILPFKPTLISAAMHAGVPVIAVAIRYPEVSGKEKLDVFFYGEMEIIPHIWNRIKAGHLQIEIEVCEIVDTSKFKHRKQLCNHVFNLISDKTLKY